MANAFQYPLRSRRSPETGLALPLPPLLITKRGYRDEVAPTLAIVKCTTVWGFALATEGAVGRNRTIRTEERVPHHEASQDPRIGRAGAVMQLSESLRVLFQRVFGLGSLVRQRRGWKEVAAWSRAVETLGATLIQKLCIQHERHNWVLLRAWPYRHLKVALSMNVYVLWIMMLIRFLTSVLNWAPTMIAPRFIPSHNIVNVEGYQPGEYRQKLHLATENLLALGIAWILALTPQQWSWSHPEFNIIARFHFSRRHHYQWLCLVLHRCLSTTVLTARYAAEFNASGDALWGARALRRTSRAATLTFSNRRSRARPLVESFEECAL